MGQQIVAVTNRLKKELTNTSVLIKSVENNGQKLNDRNDYGRIVAQLDTLAAAVTSAYGEAGTFLAGTPTSARFDMSAETHLARYLSGTVEYLRNTASGLLAQDTFSQYDRDNVNNAIGWLQNLYGLVTKGIQSQARNDMSELLERGPLSLIEAAETLARATREPKIAATVRDSRS